MFLRKSLWPSYLLGTLVAIGFVVLLAVPTPAADDKTHDQQIADIERQIAELNKKLNELKTHPPTPTPATDPSDWVKTLHWRSIGPASMGGRITAIAPFDGDPTTFWVATASGGLLKTTNNGTTFEHQFDHEGTVSIGDVAVAPSDRNVVWVGTGENNPRNSVSYGDGVYKSVDSGKTWQHMGLKKSFQIGKIVIHPKDPNIVYVGCLGRLYGPSKEDRGLFKTTDGGKNWERVLFVDDKTGVIDVKMDPSEPNNLLVAMWERQRDEFDSHRGEPALVEGYDAYDPIKKWGPGSGLYKSTDGGKNFKKITKGLPTAPLGRIGLDYYRKDPKTIYAQVDCADIGKGPLPKQVYLGVTGDDVPDGGGFKITDVTEDSPAAKAGIKADDVLQKLDKTDLKDTKSWVEAIRAKKNNDKITITLQRAMKPVEVTVTLIERELDAPSGNAKRPYMFWYGGQRENDQVNQGPNGWEYGGLYKSTDGGESWTRINSLNPRPMYFSLIRADPSDDKFLYSGGIRLYRSSDNGAKFTNDAAKGVHDDMHALWIDPRDGRHMLVGCDGGLYTSYDRGENWDFCNQVAIGQFYHVAVDNRRPYHVYGGLQDNGSWGGLNLSFSDRGPINEDWMEVNGGDGFVCRVDASDPDTIYAESQDGSIVRRNLRTGEFGVARPRVEGAPGGGGTGGSGGASGGAPTTGGYRFNWNTPFILSAQNPKILYSGGNHVFRSVKQGEALKSISPEISRTKRGTATALAESPRNPDVLWAGTDDGFLWVTKDGGAKRTNVTEKLKLPGFRWVATIEASRYADGRAYVVFDGHRSDDDAPYVYMTDDFGETWKPIMANLPTGSTRCLREDIESENLLYLGTEFAAWATLDRGKSWIKINSNLPTVAVHEFAQPGGGVDEIVVATHGRSIWVLDVSALREMTPDTLKLDAHLFHPATAVRWRNDPPRGSIYGTGSRRYVGENPTPGAQIYYSLGKKPQAMTLKVLDYNGSVVRTLETKAEPGLHKVSWDLRRTGPGAQAGDQPGGRGGRGGRGGAANTAPPGMYRLVLTVDDKEYTTSLKVEGDPGQQVPFLTEDDDDDGK